MKTWKLTFFDLFSLDMVIKGAWIYKELPETSVLQASLDATLQPYPQLLGRYDAKLKSAGPVQIIYGGYAAKIMRRKG